MRPALSSNAWLRYDAVRRAQRRLARAESMLEIGCGLGAMGHRLARGRREYVAVEPDPRSRGVAAGRLPRVVGGLDELPAGARFDAVVAFEVLEHCADEAQVLRAWVARARPGGWVMVSVPADASRWGPADEWAGHVRRYSPQQLEQALVAAGLSHVESLHYGWPLGYALEAGRNAIAAARLRRDGSDPAARTAASGRLLQPPPALGPLVTAVTAPFSVVQRAPGVRGPGLLAWGRRPGERIA